MLKTTDFTLEPRLFSVGLFNMSTIRTSLACISGFNIINKDTIQFRFIGKKSSKSFETPSVYFSSFLFSCLNSFANVFQNFQNYSVAFICACNNLFRQNVIAILAEAVYFSTKSFQMPLSRLSAFRLKLPFQSKISCLNLFPSFFPKKIIIASNGRSIDSEINTNNLTAWFYQLLFSLHAYMQKKLLILSHTQISRTHLPGKLVFIKFWNKYVNNFSAFYSGKRSNIFSKVNSIRTGVISNWASNRFWNRNFSSVFEIGFSRFQSFCSFYSGGTNELARKFGRFFFIVISKLMQFNTINSFLLPAYNRHSIEGFRISVNSLRQNSSRLLITYYWKFYCKIHQLFSLLIFNILLNACFRDTSDTCILSTIMLQKTNFLCHLKSTVSVREGL